MEITEKTREEIKKLVCQALDEREQQVTANKYVYRRVCGDLEEQLHIFDYTEPRTYINEKGVKSQWQSPVLCGYRIQEAVSTLLRITYQVNATAKLPAEQEANIRHFMQSVLNLMAELKTNKKTL